MVIVACLVLPSLLFAALVLRRASAFHPRGGSRFRVLGLSADVINRIWHPVASLSTAVGWVGVGLLLAWGSNGVADGGFHLLLFCVMLQSTEDFAVILHFHFLPGLLAAVGIYFLALAQHDCLLGGAERFGFRGSGFTLLTLCMLLFVVVQCGRFIRLKAYQDVKQFLRLDETRHTVLRMRAQSAPTDLETAALSSALAGLVRTDPAEVQRLNVQCNNLVLVERIGAGKNGVLHNYCPPSIRPARPSPHPPCTPIPFPAAFHRVNRRHGGGLASAARRGARSGETLEARHADSGPCAPGALTSGSGNDCLAQPFMHYPRGGGCG